MAGPTPVSRADPRGHDGRGRRVPGRAHVRGLRERRPVRADGRRASSAPITMLMAAFLALVQDDIKRVLAYSTISQLAYMVAALGAGRGRLTAGHVPPVHPRLLQGPAVPGRRLGHPRRATRNNMQRDGRPAQARCPTTFWTFLIGTLALAGIPPLSGFWSKDEICWSAANSERHWLVRRCSLVDGGPHRLLHDAHGAS